MARFVSHANTAKQAFRQWVVQGMLAAQGEYVGDMTVILSQEPHGAYYKNAGALHWHRVSGPGPGVHRASAPGEPPAVLSGLLRDSINSKQTGMSATQYTGAVSTEAPYAPLLEFGGVNSEKHHVEPRPAWLPTLMFNRRKYLEAVVRK